MGFEKKFNAIEIKKDYAIIHIENNIKGHFKCLIDVEDIEKVKNFYWNIRYDKRHPLCTPYVESFYKNKRIHLHRLVTNCPDDMVVDHINHNNLDNRKSNLRVCSLSINAYNKNFVKNIHYVKRDDIYNVSFRIDNKIKYFCYTRNYKEAEEYALKVKNLLLNNKIDEVRRMECKKIDLPRNNKTGCLGISKLKDGKFEVRYKQKYIGRAKTLEDAIILQKEYIANLS